MRKQNQSLEQLKNEIAQELGLTLDGNSTARECGKVGGTITRKLIELGKLSLAEQTQSIPTHIINQQEQQNQLH